MIYKLCFNQQIHRCPKSPVDFKGLVAAVKLTFKDSLSKDFKLSYLDQDGDQVIISDEEDFHSMLESLGNDNKSVKILVEDKSDAEFPEMKSFATTLVNESAFEFALEQPKVEEVKIEEPKPQESERVDLSDKKALKEFIVQTIEEVVPSLISKFMTNQMNPQKTEEKPALISSLGKLADEISNKIEKIVIGEKKTLDSMISRYGSIIPEVITVDSKQIYANVTIKNSGAEAFPANSFLQNVGGVYGDLVKIPALESQKEYNTALIMNGPKKFGKHVSKWRVGYVDNRNVTKYFGEEFEVSFNVVQLKFPKKVEERAKQLKEIFAEADMQTLLEFVNTYPSEKLEILAEQFIMNHSN